MLTHLRVKNFKCLQDVELAFLPFTVLIGQNDSGKSSLFEAIEGLAKAAIGGIQRVVTPNATLADLVWQKDPQLSIEWEVTAKSGSTSFRYDLALRIGNPGPLRERLFINENEILTLTNQNGQPTWVFNQQGNRTQVAVQQGSTGLMHLEHGWFPKTNESSVFLNMLTSVKKYRLDPAQLRRSAQLSHGSTLAPPEGVNLVAVLDELVSGREHEIRVQLEKSLLDAVPTLRGISLQTLQGGLKSLNFGLGGNAKRGITIPAALGSDGALLFLAFLALAYGGGSEILLIEEPENGLHYSRLKMVIEILRKISTGELGDRPRQVILTTHSPVLLNLVEPEEVRIFQRPDGGGTQITPMEKVANIGNLSKEFGPGELWYLLGEEGLVKEKVS
jgi:predicted ATPase